MESGISGAGVGRGRGRANQNKAPPGAAAAPSAAVQRSKELKQENQILNSYIPGLHQPGVNYPALPERRKAAAAKIRDLPEDLVKDYQKGTKNAVSALNEFCQINRLMCTYMEVGITDVKYYGQYAYRCTLDGKPYEPGIARTKKEAKLKAATIVFDTVIAGSLEEEEYVEAGGSVVDGGAGDGSGVEEVMDQNEKNPVQLLYEHCAKRGKKCDVKVHDQVTDMGFRCDIFVDNVYVATDYSNNKQNAKTRAGQLALRIILAADVPSQTEAENALHFDLMRNLARDRVNQLWVDVGRACNGNVGSTRYAAFIVMRNPEERGEVVAIGTGDGCISGKNLRLDGRCIIDCHAEIMARRALLKWFYSQMNLAFTSPDQSVFEMGQTKLKLKDSVSIHLYLSSAPCGDVAAFQSDNATFITNEIKELILSGEHNPTYDEQSYGQLRMKFEFGVVSAPVQRCLNNEYSLALVQQGEAQTRTMSCSDKILKWNTLGLQGSLLSVLTEPVYINSLTLGSQFDHPHLVRGVCCRLTQDMTELAPGYSNRHPIAGRVSVYEPTELSGSGSQSQYLSINWCAEDKLVEIIDCRTGLEIQQSPFLTGPQRSSRLCKAGFLFRFKNFIKNHPRSDLVTSSTYAANKRAAKDYQDMKNRLFAGLAAEELGMWQLRFHEAQDFEG